jgi:hypothetical protein
MCLTKLLESCYALYAQVEQNVTITTLAKTQHFLLKKRGNYDVFGECRSDAKAAR